MGFIIYFIVTSLILVFLIVVTSLARTENARNVMGIYTTIYIILSFIPSFFVTNNTYKENCEDFKYAVGKSGGVRIVYMPNEQNNCIHEDKSFYFEGLDVLYVDREELVLEKTMGTTLWGYSINLSQDLKVNKKNN